MKLSKQDLADMLQDTVGNTLSEEEVSNAIEELESNTLEIEGYIRADHFDEAEEMMWTLYNPDKPHTHPESNEFVLTCMKGDMEVVEFKTGAGFCFYNEDLGWTFVDDPYFPLFWRHLPKPPKEIKKSSCWRPLPNPHVETESQKWN